MQKTRMAAGLIISLFIIGVAYTALSAKQAQGQIPGRITGEMREVYEWAKTPEGNQILEQLPCYCGCSYEGHRHARHCFWDDSGNFDSHGSGCSTCFKIGEKAKQMSGEGKTVCEIRKEIDAFFEDYKTMATATPMPQGCV